MAAMKTHSDRPAPGGHAPRAGLIAGGHAQAADGSCSYTARVEAALRRARDSAAAHVFTALHEESAREAARHADALARAGLSAGPLAGLPVSVSGMTVNRFCSSGLQTIALAAQRIIAGEGQVYVAGGVESISCVQQEMNLHMLKDLALEKQKPEIYWNMLQTAEQVAKRYGIGREAMDEYGAASQQKARRAAQPSVPRLSLGV
jgi:acetyl-CoA acetyltransferase